MIKINICQKYRLMNILLYLIFIILILFFDSIWLYINANSYKNLVMNVQGSSLEINPIGAILSYLCVIIAIFGYIIPIVKEKNKKDNNLLYLSIVYGGGLGLLMYGIFNTTNIGIFKNYDYLTALKDTLWGIFLFTIITYLFIKIDTYHQYHN